MSLLLAPLAVGTFVCWIVAVLLLRAWHKWPDVKALRERAVAAAVIAAAGTVFLFLAIVNDVAGISDWTRVGARLCIVAIELIPGSYWLWLYWKGRF